MSAIRPTGAPWSRSSIARISDLRVPATGLLNVLCNQERLWMLPEVALRPGHVQTLPVFSRVGGAVESMVVERVEDAGLRGVEHRGDRPLRVRQAATHLLPGSPILPAIDGGLRCASGVGLHRAARRGD